VDREQRTAKRELDELNQQRESITAYLDELRELLGEGDDSAVSALTSTPLAPAGAEPGAIEEEPAQDGDSLAESAAADAAVEAEAGVVEPTSDAAEEASDTHDEGERRSQPRSDATE